jgi:hypothetical protein
MPDPLAGKREAINAREIHVLIWPDDGTGCPVAQGQLFQLRSCAIEITQIRRVKRVGGFWLWQAHFRRLYRASRPYLLAERGPGDEGHGYVRDEKGAMSAGDSDRPEWEPVEGESVPSGPPPEPEAVPPHEVEELPTTVAAQARYRKQRSEDIERNLDRSLTAQIREARVVARRHGVDVSEETALIAEATQRMMAKVRQAA